MRTISVEFEDVAQEDQYAVGRVKWFDNSKGYGFVICADFDSEILLHQNTLRNFRTETVVEGSYIEFLYQTSGKGLRVSEVLSIENINASGKEVKTDEQLEVCPEVFPARVKWYDPTKGFGFVNCFAMTEDIFIGADALKSAGFTAVSAGQALCVRIARTASGKRVYQICDWSTE